MDIVVMSACLLFLSGCQAMPLAVTYAVGAVQTYDIYHHWDDIDCKWVDLEQSLVGVGQNHIPDVGEKVEE